MFSVNAQTVNTDDNIGKIKPKRLLSQTGQSNNERLETRQYRLNLGMNKKKK